MLVTKLLFAAGALALSSIGHATIIYNWDGHCMTGSLCTEAHATVFLRDSYVPGTPVHCDGFDCDVVLWTWGFTYVNGTVEESAADNRIAGLLANGSLPVDSGATTFGLAYNSFEDIPFRTCGAPCGVRIDAPNARWTLFGESANDGVHNWTNWQPYGDSFRFYRVPEPAPILLLLAAAALFAAPRGRAKGARYL